MIASLVILFLLAGLPATAQPLSLADCLRLAQAVPSAVSVARQDAEIARQGLTIARSGFLPQTRFASGLIYNSPLASDRSTFSFLPLNGIREYSNLISLGQEFDTSGRLRAEVARARSAIDAAGANLAIAQRELKRAVTAGYYRLLLTRHIVDVVRDELAGSEAFANRTKLLFEGGEAAQADVVKASAQAAFLRQALSAAELEARTANLDLASFWTRDAAAPLELVDLLDQPAPPPEAAPAPGGFLQRMEFRFLSAQQTGLRAEARRERAALYPQASFTLSYGVDSTALRIRDRGYAAYVNLNIPVFDWFKTRSVARQFELRAQQAGAGRSIAERMFSKEYESALARVKTLYEQIGLTRAQVDLAREDLRLSTVRYQGGEGSALDVVTAQSQLTQARTNYYTNLANYLNARLDLEVTSGR